MAELILSAVGLVPLIGIALKSSQTLWTELKTFRNCNNNVRRLYKKLKYQRQIFENECELLLRDCLGDEAEVQAMVADTNHVSWNNERDESLRKLLKKNYVAFWERVSGIYEAVKKLERVLACFQALKPHKKKGEKIKDSWKRLSDGMKLSFNKSDYEGSLDDLSSAIAELGTLREQVTKLQTSCGVFTAKRPVTYQGWSDIRAAAEALYEALKSAWSCTQANHVRHFVKLFLEAEKADENVRMDIAIMCHGYSRQPGDVSMIQLQVRSGYMTWTQIPRLLVPSDSGDARLKKRIKRVRFSEGCSTTCTITQAPTSVTAQHESQDPSSDLRASRDFCAELMTRCRQKYTLGTHCLGHLDACSTPNVRHTFYPRTTTRSISSAGELLSMDAFLQPEADLSTCDRLKMARSLVVAVLKFYATPWLSDAWRLGDFSLFHQADVGAALRTLHLGVEFNGDLNSSSMEDIQLTQPGCLAEDDKLRCGIRNMTLHSLGVALLQIDRMQKLEIEDVLDVRKAATMSSYFGTRYQEITQKCLNCDFGLGADLGKGQLQKAVHDDLIGPLDEMIRSMSIEDEE